MKKAIFFIVAAIAVVSCNNVSKDNVYADVSYALMNQRVMMDSLYKSFKTKKYTDVEIENKVDSIISKSFSEAVTKYGEDTVIGAINEILGSSKKGEKVVSMEQMHMIGKLMVKKTYIEEY